VPNGWLLEGGASSSVELYASGRAGDNHGARTATSAMLNTVAAAATMFPRRRAQTDRRRLSGAGRALISINVSLIGDAWIEQAVGDIHHQVHAEYAKRHDDKQRLKSREVAA
jgi:hypothetical protein